MRQGQRDAFTREQLERVARMYKTVGEAAAALQLDTRSFARLCRQHGIENPYQRRLRERREAADGGARPELVAGEATGPGA
ncbi:hypothetical protein ACFL6X_06870 [Candidatus Latescibacterota bacterium]